MSKLAKDYHSFLLWQKLIVKIKGAVKCIQVFGTVHKRMFLFGTPKKLPFLEIKKEQKPYFFILMPNSRIRQVWMAISNSLLIYIALYIPFQVAFLGDPGAEPAFMSDYVGDIVNYLFDLDMLLTFIMAYETSDGLIEARLGRIALNYLQSWFLVDLCANFPFEVLNPLMNGSSDATDSSVTSASSLSNSTISSSTL